MTTRPPMRVHLARVKFLVSSSFSFLSLKEQASGCGQRLALACDKGSLGFRLIAVQ